jgi:hypothetical protein
MATTSCCRRERGGVSQPPAYGQSLGRAMLLCLLPDAKSLVSKGVLHSIVIGFVTVCSTVDSTSPNASSARALQVTLAPNVRLWRLAVPIAPTADFFWFAKSIADMTSAVAV